MPKHPIIEPTTPPNQTGVIMRDSKGRFIMQPPISIRGDNAHRPTEYNDKLQAKADAWLDERIGAKQVTWLEELAILLDVTDRTLERWASELNEDGTEAKPKFCRTYNKLMQWQKMVLKNNGITGKFNPRMSMFLLSANHETVEKKEIKADHTTAGKPLDMTGIPTATEEGVNEFITQGLKQKYVKPTR